MTKSLKNKLLLALTALLTVILAIFGVGLATPLQSAKADTIDTSNFVEAGSPYNDMQKSGKYFRLRSFDGNVRDTLPIEFNIGHYEKDLSPQIVYFKIDAEGFAFVDINNSVEDTFSADEITWTLKTKYYWDFYISESADLTYETLDYNQISGFGEEVNNETSFNIRGLTAPIGCDHDEAFNETAYMFGTSVLGKTIRVSNYSGGAGTNSIYFGSGDFRVDFDKERGGAQYWDLVGDKLGNLADLGCAVTLCEDGNHVDVEFLSTASYEVEGVNVFEAGITSCDSSVVVLEQKGTDTTTWYKHAYTSGTSVQGQYVRFECASGHGEMFTFHLYGLSSTSIPLAYTNGAIKTTAGYKMTGEAVVLRTTDTVVDVFFSSDFAVDKISAFDAEKMLGETKSVSIFLLSQDGTIENNPSTPVVPNNPSTPVVPDDPNTDGSGDEKPDNTDEKDLFDNVRDWLDSASEWLNENTGAQLSSGALLVIAVIVVVIVLSKKR